MAKMSTDELLDVFKEMTLIELSEFVKAFEETFTNSESSMRVISLNTSSSSSVLIFAMVAFLS